jgi:hypothetical protein
MQKYSLSRSCRLSFLKQRHFVHFLHKVKSAISVDVTAAPLVAIKTTTTRFKTKNSSKRMAILVYQTDTPYEVVKVLRNEHLHWSLSVALGLGSECDCLCLLCPRAHTCSIGSSVWCQCVITEGTSANT